MYSDNYIFSLDIGTRTVIGVVGIPEGENFKVIAADMEEHKTRAIRDGQINDIEKVAEVAQIVKERLEEKLVSN